MTLRNIRLYGRDWTPEFFTASAQGWRARWLVFLNAIRWRLELRVQWHAEYLLKSHIGEDVDAFRAEWQRDLDPPSRVLMMEDGYAQTGVRPVGTTRPDDPVTATRNLMARLTAHPRSKRYSSSRRRHVFYDLDTVAGEPINAENTETSDGRNQTDTTGPNPRTKGH